MTINLFILFTPILFTCILFTCLYFKKFTFKSIFILIVFSGIILFWGYILFSTDASDNLQRYFIPGTLDDFYTPMMKTRGNTYVDPHYSDYPPFANLIYLLFRHCISDEEVFIAENLDTRLEGAHYLGNTMGGKMIALVFFLFSFLLLFLLLENFLNRQTSKIINKILLLVLLFSGPYMFIVQRGNNIILSVFFVSFFLIFYESKNKLLRELALISLALATALKIYPVFFGIVLLKKGNYKVIFRAVLYGGIAFFGFFLFYGNSIDIIMQFANNIASRNTYKESSVYCYNYSISFLSSLRIASGFIHPGQPFEMNKILTLIPLAICTYIYCFSFKKWQKFFSIALFITWFPSASYTYLICFFTVPLLMYFEDDNEPQFFNIIYLLCFCLLFMPFNLPRIDGFFREAQPHLQLTYGTIILHLAIWTMVLFMILEITLKKRNLFKKNNVSAK